MNIYEKLLEVQKEIKPIVKDSTNPHFKNKYFDINTLLAEVKPILIKHGVVLTQCLTHIDGKIALNTTLALSNRKPEKGDFETNDSLDLISSTCPLPECADAQKYGSAITYFRRYAVQSILALEAEDDDGNTAKSTPQATKTLGNISKGYSEPIKAKVPSKADVEPVEGDLEWM